MSPSTLLRLTAGRIATQNSPPAAIRLRWLHYSPIINFPRKDSQDKDSINTEATEYSKSGSDDKTAGQEQAAFDPNETDPEKERSTAGKGNEESGNPLDVSPANPEVSKQKPMKESGVENSSADRKRSGPGSPEKGKKG